MEQQEHSSQDIFISWLIFCKWLIFNRTVQGLFLGSGSECDLQTGEYFPFIPFLIEDLGDRIVQL